MTIDALNLTHLRFRADSVKTKSRFRVKSGFNADHFAHEETKLGFTPEEFYYSMAMTAILPARVPLSDYQHEARAFELRYGRHLLFDSEGVRLRADRRHYYKDFDRWHFSSRYGEAIGHLVALKTLGFPEIHHFENARHLVAPRSYWSGFGKRPDYVLRDGDHLAFAEFKGHSASESRAPFKGSLRKALRQCEEMEKKARVKVHEWIGVSSVLNVDGDSEPSFIAEARETPQRRSKTAEKSVDAERGILGHGQADWSTAVSLGAAVAQLSLAGFEEIALPLLGLQEPSTNASHVRVWRLKRGGEALVFRRTTDSVGSEPPYAIGIPQRVYDHYSGVVSSLTQISRDRPIDKIQTLPVKKRESRRDSEVTLLGDGGAVSRSLESAGASEDELPLPTQRPEFK